MDSESTQALIDQYRRMHAQYRALGERLRAALGKRGGGPAAESERSTLFRQLQKFHAEIELVQQELRRRADWRAKV